MNSLILVALLVFCSAAVEATYEDAPKYSSFGYAAAKIATNTCPPGWSQYHNSCYYFSRDRMSWWQASMKCASMGGYLCNIDEAHENTYIRHHLAMYQGSNLLKNILSFMVVGPVTPGAWFALNDCLYPNAHRWGWGFTNKRCHKFDWYAGEPVYHQKGDYNCGVFWSTYKYHWHVDSCTQRNYYVCEMKLGKPCKCQY